MRPTQAAKIPTRREVVTLKHLKDAEGAPVSVLVLRVGQITLMAALGALPMPSPIKAGDGEANVAEDTVAQLERYAYPMIERTVFLESEDGTPKRPSFTAKPVTDAIWLGELHVEDVVLMFETAAKLNGWLGGPADELGFHAGADTARREGGRAGDDAVDAGEGKRVPTLRFAPGGPGRAGG